MKKNTIAGRALAAGLITVSVAALAACGDATDATTNAAAATTEGSTSIPVPTGAPGADGQSGSGSSGTNGTNGQGRGGIDAATQTKITSCLKAAGITVPTMGPRPTGAPNGGTGSGTGGTPPNGGTPPTGAPNADGTAGRPGGGGIFGSTEAQAALKACGITLPERPAGAGTGAPSGTSN